jgi:hypothetical protein
MKIILNKKSFGLVDVYIIDRTESFLDNFKIQGYS